MKEFEYEEAECPQCGMLNAHSDLCFKCGLCEDCCDCWEDDGNKSMPSRMRE
jgi:hypothetical protein